MTEISLGLFCSELTVLMTVISQLFVPFYSIVTTAIYRHLRDSTTNVRFTIAVYRDYRQYRASLVDIPVQGGPKPKLITS